MWRYFGICLLGSLQKPLCIPFWGGVWQTSCKKERSCFALQDPDGAQTLTVWKQDLTSFWGQQAPSTAYRRPTTTETICIQAIGGLLNLLAGSQVATLIGTALLHWSFSKWSSNWQCCHTGHQHSSPSPRDLAQRFFLLIPNLLVILNRNPMLQRSEAYYVDRNF